MDESRQISQIVPRPQRESPEMSSPWLRKSFFTNGGSTASDP